jgi:hypothetical protein
MSCLRDANPRIVKSPSTVDHILARKCGATAERRARLSHPDRWIQLHLVHSFDNLSHGPSHRIIIDFLPIPSRHSVCSPPDNRPSEAPDAGPSLFHGPSRRWLKPKPASLPSSLSLPSPLSHPFLYFLTPRPFRFHNRQPALLEAHRTVPISGQLAASLRTGWRASCVQ